MPVEDFKDAFKHYTITYLHDDYHNSFIEKRNAVNRKNYRFNFTISDDDVVDATEAAPESKPAAKPEAVPAAAEPKATKKG